MPVDLDRDRAEDWRARVEQARSEGVVDLTDEEVDRIVNYLEANYP